MGEVLHGCATTTHAVRTAIQRSKAPLKELAARHGLNHKTVAKWRKRAFVNDAPMGPKRPHSTVLSSAFWRWIVLPVPIPPLCRFCAGFRIVRLFGLPGKRKDANGRVKWNWN